LRDLCCRSQQALVVLCCCGVVHHVVVSDGKDTPPKLLRLTGKLGLRPYINRTRNVSDFRTCLKHSSKLNVATRLGALGMTPSFIWHSARRAQCAIDSIWNQAKVREQPPSIEWWFLPHNITNLFVVFQFARVCGMALQFWECVWYSNFATCVAFQFCEGVRDIPIFRDHFFIFDRESEIELDTHKNNRCFVFYFQY
jgi:hypothetical protein